MLEPRRAATDKLEAGFYFFPLQQSRPCMLIRSKWLDTIPARKTKTLKR